MSEQVRQK